MEEEIKIVIEKKILLIGTQASYNALGTYDEEALYFCSDTRNIYKGSQLYTDGIRRVTTRPQNPATGILYFVTSTETLEFYDGTNWIEVSIKITPVDSISDESTENEIPSAKSVYDFVTTLVNEATGNISLDGAVMNPTYDKNDGTLTLPVTGKETIVVKTCKPFGTF